MTSERDEEVLGDVAPSLAGVLGVSTERVIVDRIEDLSPRIGSSRIFRVVTREVVAAAAGATSFILKVPDWGAATLIEPDGPLVSRRERLVVESGLASRLPHGLRAPAVLGVDRVGDRTWLWMEDVRRAVDIIWDEAAALLAARRSVLLHAMYLREGVSLHRLDWLQREHYAAYAHHAPAAHRSLAACQTHPVWSGLFTADEVAGLHDLLDQGNAAISELRRLPITLIHGDFHIANLGIESNGTLVLLDWAHVGIGPLGCDVATLASLFHVFGGVSARSWADLEHELIAGYADEIARLAGRSDLGASIERAAVLWHRTWGLHLRLGPGLTYLLRDEQDSPPKRRTAADIYEGCTRALT